MGKDTYSLFVKNISNQMYNNRKHKNSLIDVLIRASNSEWVWAPLYGEVVSIMEEVVDEALTDMWEK